MKQNTFRQAPCDSLRVSLLLSKLCALLSTIQQSLLFLAFFLLLWSDCIPLLSLCHLCLFSLLVVHVR